MAKKSPKVTFSVSCSKEHKAEFIKICTKENRSQSSMFETMIDAYKKKNG